MDVSFVNIASKVSFVESCNPKFKVISLPSDTKNILVDKPNPAGFLELKLSKRQNSP